MPSDSSDSESRFLKYDQLKEIGNFNEQFQNFDDLYTGFQYFIECRNLLTKYSYIQESFFCSLDEASPIRLRIYLKKNGFPQTLGDMELFINKFGSLSIKREKEKETLTSELAVVIDERKEVNKKNFKIFNEGNTKLYSAIIIKYERLHGEITPDNYSHFLKLCSQDMLDLHISQDILSGSIIKDKGGKLSVVDFRSSQSVQFYAQLKNLDIIDISEYSFLETSAISLHLQEKAIAGENAISGRDISHVGVGIIVEGASCPILQVEGDRVTYGDQLIDTSEFPPVKFITSPTQSNYKLQSCELEFDADVKLIQEKEKILGEMRENTEGLKGVEVHIESFKQKQENIIKADLSDEVVLDHLFSVYRTNKRITALIEEIDSCGNTKERQKALREMILDFISNTMEKFLIVKSDLEDRNQRSMERLRTIKEHEERSIANYQRILKEKDDDIRSNLRLLDALGFTLLDQSFTDMLVNEINHVEGFKGAIELGAGFSICEEINLAEGQFGNSKGQNRMELLVRCFNKAISGNPHEPNSIRGFVSGSTTCVGNKTKFIADLSSKYNIQNANGTFNIQQARQNLKKPLSA